MSEKIVRDGKWNGYFIETSSEALIALLCDGYRYGCSDCLSCDFVSIVNGAFSCCDPDDVEFFDIKPLYLVDGELSATEYNPDDVAFKSAPVVSDGGSNSFYIFPDYVCDVDSLCRYWELSSAEGNILKSLTANLGSRHSGTDKTREVRKSLHYSIERMKWDGFTDEDILDQVKKRLSDANEG